MQVKESATTTAESPLSDTAPLVLRPTPADFVRAGGRQLSASEQNRVERTHNRVPVIVDRARNAGVDITYLGIANLFNESRLYRGADNDWTLAPLDEDHPPILPSEQQQLLRRLTEARVAPFLTYVAHEVDRTKTAELLPALPDVGRTILSKETAAELVGPVPEHGGTVELANRLEQNSTTVLSAIRKGGVAAGKVAVSVMAAPFLAVGALASGVATLDPILIGAVPILRTEDGQPALFFELCRWDW